jgi:hypothetical protein
MYSTSLRIIGFAAQLVALFETPKWRPLLVVADAGHRDPRVQILGEAVDSGWLEAQRCSLKSSFKNSSDVWIEQNGEGKRSFDGRGIQAAQKVKRTQKRRVRLKDRPT